MEKKVFVLRCWVVIFFQQQGWEISKYPGVLIVTMIYCVCSVQELDTLQSSSHTKLKDVKNQNWSQITEYCSKEQRNVEEKAKVCSRKAAIKAEGRQWKVLPSG